MTKKRKPVDPLMVYTLAEACEVIDLSAPLLTRALHSGQLKGGKAESTGGFRVTGRAILEWVDGGMPGLEPPSRTKD